MTVATTAVSYSFNQNHSKRKRKFTNYNDILQPDVILIHLAMGRFIPVSHLPTKTLNVSHPSHASHSKNKISRLYKLPPAKTLLGN